MIRIRRATGADAATLTRIVLGSSAYAGDYAQILDGYEITAAQIARDEVHVAEDGAALGLYSLKLGDAPELDLLFVDDAAQGRGVGRLLFDHMRGLAREKGVRAIKIVAHPPAAAFYRRMGAIEVGVAYPMRRVTWPRPIFTLPV